MLGLRAAGANVLGIADVHHEQLRPELREALTDYYRVDGLHNHDQLVRALGFFTHRHGRIDRLDSLNEHWLAAEAALRTPTFTSRASTGARSGRSSASRWSRTKKLCASSPR